MYLPVRFFLLLEQVLGQYLPSLIHPCCAKIEILLLPLLFLPATIFLLLPFVAVGLLLTVASSSVSFAR